MHPTDPSYESAPAAEPGDSVKTSSDTSDAGRGGPRRGAEEYAYVAFTGLAMGAADVVPGVSGGTMAFIMGLYRELIEAIKSFDLALLRKALSGRVAECLEQVPWRFLLALGSGIGASILGLAHLVGWLLEHRQVELYALFFGLVLASIVSVSREVEWSAKTVASLVVGTAVAYWIVGLVPAEMPHDPLTIFLSGSVAISAMILPGISGSFILLILGQYEYVLGAVKELDVLVLVPLAAGCVVGLVVFSRILSWLFVRHRQLTVTLLVGFMLGSLRKIWPFKEVVETRIDRHGEVVPLVERNLLPDPSSARTWIALGLAIAGLVAILALDRLRLRMISKEEPGAAAF